MPPEIARGPVALALAQLDDVEHLSDPGAQRVAPHPVEASRSSRGSRAR